MLGASEVAPVQGGIDHSCGALPDFVFRNIKLSMRLIGAHGMIYQCSPAIKSLTYLYAQTLRGQPDSATVLANMAECQAIRLLALDESTPV